MLLKFSVPPVLCVFSSRRPPVLRVFDNRRPELCVLPACCAVCCAVCCFACCVCCCACCVCRLLPGVLCVLLCVLFVLCMLLFVWHCVSWNAWQQASRRWVWIRGTRVVACVVLCEV